MCFFGNTSHHPWVPRGWKSQANRFGTESGYLNNEISYHEVSQSL